MLGVMRTRWAIAVDVGGTFTDLVMVSSAGSRRVVKVPSVPTDPSRGVFDALDEAGRLLETRPADLLSSCDRFVHGSTIATNAVLTGALANVGLVTTAGFRDALEIRRGIRDDQWDHRAPWPPVLVPRHRRLGVEGRIAADGSEVVPLDEEGLNRALDALDAQAVEAVAICLLHSYANAAHERRAAEMARRRWPGHRTTVSSELVPVLGEYARSSTAVINAGLVPVVESYLSLLDAGLRERGLACTLLLLQSNGGTVPVQAVMSRPVDLVLSGPAAVGGATQQLAGDDDALISMEIGGTSCDVAVTVGGTVPVLDGLEVGGYHLAVPAVDIHTVGAGGGTIATVDDAGLLRVGPDGAGADPGPACYGRGGEYPTATDVHLVLGRLRAGSYAGGSLELDAELARQALLAHVARPLGVDLESAAIGVLRLLEQHLRHAVETITIERGRDPRKLTLVAAGGAGGLHGVAVARALGCPRVVVPAEAGVFCANGMLASDLRRDVTHSVTGKLDELGHEHLVAALERQQAHVDGLCAREWPHDIRTHSTWHVDLRYPGQLWSVRVPVEHGATSSTIRGDFEAEYERLFGHIQPGGTLDLTGLGVTVHGHLPRVVGSPPQARGRLPAQPLRRCWVDHITGWVEVPVHHFDRLGRGAVVDGPFLIEGATTTVLGGAGDRLLVNERGDLEITLS